MKYLVMECHPGYAVLLDQQGRFVKAANFGYAVGQTVQDPVLMKTPSRAKARLVRWVGAGMLAAAACLALAFGLGYYQNYLAPYSSIYLSINPSVQLDLNRQGTVVALYGVNADGKALLQGYQGKGKDKLTVTDELIDRAIEMGFLAEGGQVQFSIDTPDEALFQEYGVQLRTEVQQHTQDRMTVTVQIVSGAGQYLDDDDDDDGPGGVGDDDDDDDNDAPGAAGPDADDDANDDADDIDDGDDADQDPPDGDD